MRDPHHPQYHFRPPANWMSDPNGLIQWKGRYHLFYQYPLVQNQQGRMKSCWGHAVSDDLVRWRHLPVALAPTPGGPDSDGCASGCAVDRDGEPALMYTGVFPPVACLATGSDDLVHWHKHPQNPVIPGPPAGLDVVGFRDHSVWHEGDAWCQVIGCGLRGQGGALPLFRSPDLIRWEYLGLLYAGDAEQTGPMWECPDFFPLGDRRVLVVSACPARGLLKGTEPEGLWVAYFVGDYRNRQFEPSQQGRVDLGAHFYAPQTLCEASGRRLMWGWLREGRSVEAQQAAGWSGVMSLPRVLSLDPEGRLLAEPAPELRALRRAHRAYAGVELPPDGRHDLDVHGAQLEIVAEFAPASSGTAGLLVRRSPGGEEETLIAYNYADDRLELDCRRASLDLTTDRPLTGGSLRLPRHSPLRLHVYLDGSVIEVFANGRAAASRVYPTRPDSLGVQAFSRRPSRHETSGSVAAPCLTRLDVWALDSIWDGSERIPQEV